MAAIRSAGRDHLSTFQISIYTFCACFSSLFQRIDLGLRRMERGGRVEWQKNFEIFEDRTTKTQTEKAKISKVSKSF